MSPNSNAPIARPHLNRLLKLIRHHVPTYISQRLTFKWILFLVVLLHFKSWPFVWHFRVLRPVMRSWAKHMFLSLRLRIASKRRADAIEEEWIDSEPLVGMSPFDYRNTYSTRATLDECDYNIHLSNSSYAKILDASRFECLVTLFPVFFRLGGKMALGATHFHFIREIPPLCDFEIRTFIGGWDQKWVYLVSKFVSKPKRRAPGGRVSSNFDSSDSGSPTPPSQPVRALLSEPDGSTLHTVAVTQLCFKAARITVPPSIVLASNGFCSPPPHTGDDSTTTYSGQNPPPHWAALKRLALAKYGGGKAKYFDFIREGWKSLPAGDDTAIGNSPRWWEDALGGETEVRRVAALAELEMLRKGLEGARSL